ncbi:hypothetical protein [Vibrio lentus]|uniref:hypothetical protein n=1 Tax=Vibrio lentus TaxID=136468 RepID=UPI000976257E|nr:hypothetical protein [Vibrio lentus]OMO22110.1 hypothetical protein BH583_07950 [Vibrio lentus]PMN15400.1 hypothetical protein BCT38_01720 [Vibrio lentus]
MNKYKKLIIRASDKIPFSTYISRLKFFFIDPKFGGNTYAHDNQKEHSFIDIFNGLGLLALIISMIILYDRGFNEFKIILALNPLFIVFSWVSNAIVFSFVSASVLTSALFWTNSTANFTQKCKSLYSLNISKKTKNDFYNIFTHGLRSYAVTGLVLGLVFIKMLGSVFLEGKHPAESLGTVFWILYVLGATFVLLRMCFYPYVNYCKVIKNRVFNTICVLTLVALSFEPLQWIPFDYYQDKLLDQSALCELFKKSEFIRLVPEHRKEEAISKVCNFT